MPQSRREFLATAAALWSAAALRAQQHQHAHPSNEKALYTFAFLNGGERRTLRVLMDRIVPADDRSSGALGAYVDEYIDFILLHADASLQETWRKGLKGHGEAIVGKSGHEVDTFLEQQAQNEFSPASDDEAFFILLKSAVTEGFYTSEQGINNELGYKGMTFVLDFQGCTHASHRTPEGWHPMLRDRKET
ncbi:MAG: gluconate 2-dehydrogenase subunit 3 family protein [Bryobacteraceae bacterium]